MMPQTGSGVGPDFGKRSWRALEPLNFGALEGSRWEPSSFPEARVGVSSAVAWPHCCSQSQDLLLFLPSLNRLSTEPTDGECHGLNASPQNLYFEIPILNVMVF